jgi:radical SAM protein with 4Fe4S-binding SPASM domain
LYLTTNGVDLGDFVKELREINHLREVNISLNSENWDEILDSAEELKTNKMRVNVMYPLSKKNSNRMDDIFAATKNRGIDSLVFLHLMFNKGDRYIPDAKTILSKLKEQGRSRVRVFPPIKNHDIKRYYLDAGFPEKDKCLRPWFVAYIMPDGGVVPCERSDILSFGNIKEESLASIWNNIKFRNYRKNIHRNGVNKSLCFRCCHRQYY